MVLTPRLAELEAQLIELNRPAAALLQTGVDAAQVSATLGGDVPDGVAEWFAWHNGVAGEPGQIQDDVNVVPGYAPVSIAEATGMKQSYEGDPLLGPNWIPLLAGPGADIYAAVWDSGATERVAGVLVGEPTEYEFDSIEQMVAVFNECYRRRAYFVNPQGRLDIDPDIYDEVYAERA